MTWAIEARGLTKRFPAQQGWRGVFSRARLARPAVDQVDLNVKRGELFGLVGPNGAGKTTFIKLLCTLILPTGGTARVNGFPLSLDQRIKASIGLVTGDERSFYWRLTGRQNLAFFASLHRLPADRLAGRVDEVLDQMGLLDVADQPFQTYSSGTRQRLSIARALLNQPGLLFLDEPSKGLDPSATRKLHRLIREDLTLAQGLTVFLTTHQLWEAEALCDRLAIIHEGRVRACGTLHELGQQVAAGDPVSLETIFHALTDPDGGLTGDERVNRGTAQALKSPAAMISPEKERGALSQATTASSDDFGAADARGQKTAAAGQSGVRHGLRVAWAFLKRDLISETTYRLSFLLQFFGVFFSVTVFFFVGRLLDEATIPSLAPYGGDYFSFVLIGIAFAGYFGVGLSGFSRSLRNAQTTGTLEAMLTTPTGLSTIILSSSLWNYSLTTVRVLIYLFIGAALLGVDLAGGNYLAGLLTLGLTIVSFSSFGIIAASFIMVLKRGDPVTWVAGALSSLLGGVYYPIEVLPGWLQPLSRLIPVTYALRAMRLALLQDAPLIELIPDLMILAAFGVVLLPLSLLSFRYAVRRARLDGSLTHY